MARIPLDRTLPDFPWNHLEPAKAKAAAYPDGLINLSVGSPVDEVSPGIQLALAEHGGAPGYPQTIGTPQLRQAITNSLARRYNVHTEAVLPVVGTKEAIALLPLLLGVRGTVVIPTVAYPTYEVAAKIAGAQVIASDSPWELDPETAADVDLVFINYPSNPTGAVLDVEGLRRHIEWARRHDAILASDECYLGLTWDKPAFSILDKQVAGEDHSKLLAIHSLSKTSNLASYRAGFFAGDAALIAELTEVRKHAGLMMPGPVQAAMAYALDDDLQEQAQRIRYQQRREVLKPALEAAGFSIHESVAGLYLWITRDEDCWETVDWFAERGILVAPGCFYGEQSTHFVRVALTGTDEQIMQAVTRLKS